jgi:uncharacterized membrane protein YdjX (TVP38/TMEM64 family)
MKKDRLETLILAIFGIALIFLTLKYVKPEEVKPAVENLGIYGVLIFILAKAASRIVVPASGTPLYILGAVAYGPFIGSLYSFVGDMIGGAISFYISRRFGKELALKFLGSVDSEIIPKILETISTVRGLAVVHFFLIAFPDVINYTAGLGNIPMATFLTIHAPFALASALVVSYGSHYAYNFGNIGIIFFIIFVIMLGLIGSFLLKRYSEKKPK